MQLRLGREGEGAQRRGGVELSQPARERHHLACGQLGRVPGGQHVIELPQVHRQRLDVIDVQAGAVDCVGQVLAVCLVQQQLVQLFVSAGTGHSCSRSVGCAACLPGCVRSR